MSPRATLEYKREMPGRGDPVPFLAAVSSFANTSGGDLLVGVEAEEGVPIALPGVEVASVDQETLRLTQVVGTGLDPRLPHLEFQFVEVDDGRYVIVVRVPHSWVAPHRVKKNDKFYGRNSAGKFPLDVGELRTAFTLSESVAESVECFWTSAVRQLRRGGQLGRASMINCAADRPDLDRLERAISVIILRSNRESLRPNRGTAIL